MDDNDKSIKALQEDLENDEEDWTLSEFNVSLLRDMSEDIQSVDSLYKEVQQFKHKKEEVSLLCGDVAGNETRTLEQVRAEEEEVDKQLKVARKNMEECQDIVNKQKSLLNKFE